MKFHIAINLERMTPDTSMVAVKDHVEWMIKAADDAGFEIAWAAEHHALEMTIAPNPFQIMMWWAGITQKMRLGCGVANAAYWHPINIAGEAALLIWSAAVAWILVWAVAPINANSIACVQV